jgi:hypothetical protein
LGKTSQKNDLSQIGVTSRIKNIYVRLYNYYFHHGTADINKMGSRFIGRKDIIRKLKTILSFSNSKSGAYLVTGYRGMGKSSYVNKVIEDLDFSRIKNKSVVNFIRINALVFLLILFNSLFVYVSSGIMFAINVFYNIRKIIQCSNSDKGFIYKNVGVKLRSVFKMTFGFSTEKTVHPDATHKRFFLNLSKGFYLCSLVKMLFPANPGAGILFSVVLSSLILFHSLLRTADGDKLSEKFKNFFNFSRNIYIKINLGYDNLREIDILKLLSNSIEKEFAKFQKFSIRNFYLKLAKILFIVLISFNVFSNPHIRGLNHQLFSSAKIGEYFPSQKSIHLENIQYSQAGKLFIEDFYNEEIKDKIKTLNLKTITRYLDFSLVFIYQKSLSIIPAWIRNNMWKYLKFPPPALNYLFLLYIILFWCFFYRFLALIFKVNTEKSIKKKIKKLNQDIEYEFEKSTGKEIADKNFFMKFFYKIKVNRKQADVREIENRLSEILELCANINLFSLRPEFIFIFDELDKVSSDDKAENGREGSDRSFNLTESYFGTGGIQKKQVTVFKILSNLKHFINSSNAKYIFIAGRELYDAALADISDRNFFIGSIFDKANVYVISFLSEEAGSSSSITSMTERYICQFLFPSEYDMQGEEPSLQAYRNYLIKIYKHKVGPKANLEYSAILEIEKIINTLRSFIIYITYRSNGAPKKISAFFEEYIKNIERNSRTDNSIAIDIAENRLHLFFNEQDQYSFSIHSYLITPIYLSINESGRTYNDKLLISIAFLVDHLYKFHKNAFSWSDIELTPELLDVNKSPQLRGVIKDLLTKLSDNHLLQISSGFYEFKFRKKISEEIASLSIISEKESAAFNFTLDESQALKEYFQNKLNRTLKNHYQEKITREFKNSIYSLHMTLGDIYFFDNEYNESIRHYQEAIKYLKRTKDDKSSKTTFSYIQDYIKSMLKLGFVYEKQYENQKALVIYSELVSEIINYRYIDIALLGLEVKKISKVELAKFTGKKTFKPLVPITKDRLDGKKDQINVLVARIDQSVREEFNRQIEYDEVRDENKIIGLVEDFQTIMNIEPFTKIKGELLINITSIEGLNLIHQPLLAKLHVIEKTHMEGITRVDLIRIEQEYNYITRTTAFREKHIMAADFWSKVGDVLYFKNRFFNNSADCLRNKCSKGDGCSYKYEENDLRSACYYYKKAFIRLCYDLLGINCSEHEPELDKLIFIFHSEFQSYKKQSRNEVIFRVGANIIAGLGNICYSDADYNEIESTFLQDFLQACTSLEKFNKFLDDRQEKKRKKIERSLICFYISYRLFLSSGNFKEGTMQLQKILFIIRNLLTSYNKGKNNTCKEIIIAELSSIQEGIVNTSIRNLYRAYNNIHRVEIDDFKKLTIKDEYRINDQVLLKNTTLSANIREIVLLFNEIHIRCNWKNYICNYLDFQTKSPISPYSITNSKFRLMMELKQKVMINFHILKEMFKERDVRVLTSRETLKTRLKQILQGDLHVIASKTLGKYFDQKVLKKLPPKEGAVRAIEHLIDDSIYCCHKIITISEIYNLSYLINHSMVAYIFFWKAEWSKLYFTFTQTLNNYNQRTGKGDDRKPIEPKTLDTSYGVLSAKYLFEKSRESFQAINDLHSGGKIYKRMIENMFYLNEDYNDTFNHFHTAAERFRLKNGKFSSILQYIKEELQNSKIYNFDSHR